jgi:acyl-CoA-binding protein
MDVVRSVELPTGNDRDFELYSLFGQISVGDAP